MAAGPQLTAFLRARRRLVERLRSNGIDDLAILHAIDSVPRHHFVPEELQHRAYEDVALPIGFGQTISRPSVHALHLQLAGLRGGERVLEVGTGSGFQTALLARLGAEVYSIDVVPELVERAEEKLAELDIHVELRTADGGAGWPEAAPFDVILVGAAGSRLPGALLAQLAEGGRLIAPVGSSERQVLVRMIRHEEEYTREEIDSARFVPFVKTAEGKGGREVS